MSLITISPEIKKIRPVIYISGPYTKINKKLDVKFNIHVAHEYAFALRSLGFAVICPHSNGGEQNSIPEEFSWEDFIEEDYSIILSVHGMFMLPNWEMSKGARIENQWAKNLGIPIFYCQNNFIAEKLSYRDLVLTGDLLQICDHYQNKNSVWEKSPNQVHEFLKIINKMFRVHLKKNQDYSSFNILCTGEIGLMTRVWDKVSRLMNLIGFNIMTGKLDNSNKSPQNESVDDSILDLSVYSIIWQILRKGKWGV